MTRPKLWIGIMLLAAGCGHAELVRRDMQGGTLALVGDRNKAWEDANNQMMAHCRGPYTIVSEEQAVVGQATQTQNAQQYGYQSSYGAQTSMTNNVTQYRVTYACGAAAGPAGATAPPPPPRQ